MDGIICVVSFQTNRSPVQALAVLVRTVSFADYVRLRAIIGPPQLLLRVGLDPALVGFLFCFASQAGDMVIGMHD